MQGTVVHGNGKGLERIWVHMETLLVRIVNRMDREMVLGKQSNRFFEGMQLKKKKLLPLLISLQTSLFHFHNGLTILEISVI